MLDGNKWEKLCIDCLQEKFREETFAPIPARTEGDFGLDGFTKTGILFQCYNPNEIILNPKNLYENQRDKITKDLNKLIKYQKEIEKLLSGVKVKKWIFLTQEISNKELQMHASKKQLEFRKMNINLLRDDFQVVAQDVTYINKYISSSNSHEWIFESDVKEYNISLEKNLKSEWIKNLDRKLNLLYPGVSEKRIKKVKENHIVKYFMGESILKKIEKTLPEQHRLFLKIVNKIELNLEEEILLNHGENKEIYKTIKSKLKDDLKNNLSEKFYELVFENMSDYLISLWLLTCPLDFD
ncbi:MAG: hypothetical protein Q7K48_06145 [Fusobacterium sp. JB021]|nr:hypothetical protein [Fusobacterium sp. JB021]